MFEYSSKRQIEEKAGGPIDWAAAGWSKQFIVLFHFIGWDHWQLGFHVCFSLPNIEIHVPAGFFRIGWVWKV